MKLVKYVGAAVLIVVALTETVPIYLISWGLFLGQGGESTMYFVGKLVAHVLLALIAAALATKLFQSARNSNNEAS